LAIHPLLIRQQAWGFLVVLVGGLLLSREVEDRALAKEILTNRREAAGNVSSKAAAYPEIDERLAKHIRRYLGLS